MKIDIGPYQEKDRIVNIHIEKWDTWNMDHTLALIIHPMLIQLKETNHGYPAGITEEEWDEIQDKMIWSFERIINQWDEHLVDVDRDKKVQEGLDLFGKWFRNLWD